MQRMEQILNELPEYIIWNNPKLCYDYQILNLCMYYDNGKWYVEYSAGRKIFKKVFDETLKQALIKMNNWCKENRYGRQAQTI